MTPRPTAPTGPTARLAHSYVLSALHQRDNADSWLLSRYPNPRVVTANSGRSLGIYARQPRDPIFRASTSAQNAARQVHGQKCKCQDLPGRANMDISFIEETSHGESETFAVQHNYRAALRAEGLQLGSFASQRRIISLPRPWSGPRAGL